MEEGLLFKKVTELYDAGKFGEVIELVREAYPDLTKASSGNLEKLAWSHYRRNEFGLARSVAMTGISIGYEDLESVKVQIDTNYVDKKTNIKVVMDILSEDKSDPKICNVFIVAARNEENPKQYIAQALEYVQKFKNSDSIAAINMQHNMGRLYLAIGDYEAAIDYLNRAYERYGSRNFHHRAALQYWVYDAYMKLGDKDSATLAAERSYVLWQEAVEADPSNEVFKEKMANAKSIHENLAT